MSLKNIVIFFVKSYGSNSGHVREKRILAFKDVLFVTPCNLVLVSILRSMENLFDIVFGHHGTIYWQMTALEFDKGTESGSRYLSRVPTTLIHMIMGSKESRRSPCRLNLDQVGMQQAELENECKGHRKQSMSEAGRAEHSDPSPEELGLELVQNCKGGRKHRWKFESNPVQGFS